MRIKLLIDECLLPSRVDDAQAAGFFESTCVRNRGLAGMEHRHLMPLVIAEDFTLVASNSKDFRSDGDLGRFGHAFFRCAKKKRLRTSKALGE